MVRPGAGFDAVWSVNGIWGGCDEAAREARRVVVVEWPDPETAWRAVARRPG